MEEIIKKISKLNTLMIPIIANGMPHVRLDELEQIFWDAGVDASPITDRIHNLMSLYRNEQIDVH